MTTAEHIRDLWKQVFIAAIRKGDNTYIAQIKADEAVDLFRKRFS